MIVTGRFQPLHNDHLQFLREVRRRHDGYLAVCILRRHTPVQEFQKAEGISPSQASRRFRNASAAAFDEKDNPLPDWNRLILLKKALQGDEDLSDVVIMLRDRPDLSWSLSIRDLPETRVWAIHIESELGRAKLDFYRSRGESVVPFEGSRSITATDVRARIRSGSGDLSWLPTSCHEYFMSECLQFFVGDRTDP